MTVTLFSTDYHNKIKMVLGDLVFRRLTVDLTGRIERQMGAVMKKSDVPAELAKQGVTPKFGFS